MTHLLGDVVDRCLNTWLLGTFRAQMNQVGTPVTDGTSTTISVALPLADVARGSLVAIDDELMFVVDRDTTQQTLTVVRGVRGSAPGQHRAGAVIEINPRFPRTMVRQVMAEEIDGWPHSLYRTTSIQITSVPRNGLLDVGAFLSTQAPGFIPHGIVRIRRLSLDPTDNRWRRTDGFEVDFDLLTEGGMLVNLSKTVDMNTTFQVVVAGEFDTSGMDDDGIELEGDVGLQSGMCEILELGTAYRLLMGRGSVRLFPESEGQSRNAAEVGAHDIPAQAQMLRQMREAAIAREAMKLYKRHGFGDRT